MIRPFAVGLSVGILSTLGAAYWMRPSMNCSDSLVDSVILQMKKDWNAQVKKLVDLLN